jgi:hypothetical protein
VYNRTKIKTFGKKGRIIILFLNDDDDDIPTAQQHCRPESNKTDTDAIQTENAKRSIPLFFFKFPADTLLYFPAQ